jgi:hypothetical protein
MRFTKSIVFSFISAVALMVSAGIAASAQTPVEVRNAELSVPFGVAAGKLLTVGDHLVLLDEEKPEASFAIARNVINNLSNQDETATVETSRMVRDPSAKEPALSVASAKPNP